MSCPLMSTYISKVATKKHSKSVSYRTQDPSLTKVTCFIIGGCSSPGGRCNAWRAPLRGLFGGGPFIREENPLLPMCREKLNGDGSRIRREEFKTDYRTLNLLIWKEGSGSGLKTREEPYGNNVPRFQYRSTCFKPSTLLCGFSSGPEINVPLLTKSYRM